MFSRGALELCVVGWLDVVGFRWGVFRRGARVRVRERDDDLL